METTTLQSADTGIISFTWWTHCYFRQI